jgi:hypothetical protein
MTLPPDSADRTISFAQFRAKIKGAAFVRDSERSCQHHKMIIDPKQGTLECDDCGRSLSAFVTLLKLVEGWEKIDKWKDDCRADAKRWQERAALTYKTMRSWRPHLRAVKEFEKLWRRNSGPCCPHCGHALLPEDFSEGERSVHSREYELSTRTKAAKDRG